MLKVKNFEKFQHYKDRNPPWIKLHVLLLKDYEFSSLPDAAKSHLMSIWILASMMDNRIPSDPEWIERQINSTEPIDLDLLIGTGFLIETEDPPEVKEKWPSRYVPDALKAQVLERAGHKCECCGATENLEIDHVVPVSKGGKSILENLQVLCRRCNRKKRQRSTSAEQLATQITGTRAGPTTHLRSPEAEAEAEAEAETEKEKRESRGGSGENPSPASRAKPRSARAPVLPDDEWLDEKQKNPAYSSLDVRHVYHKMLAWCEVNGKQPSRRRLINWLNTESKPMTAKASPPKKPDPGARTSYTLEEARRLEETFDWDGWVETCISNGWRGQLEADRKLIAERGGPKEPWEYRVYEYLNAATDAAC